MWITFVYPADLRIVPSNESRPDLAPRVVGLENTDVFGRGKVAIAYQPLESDDLGGVSLPFGSKQHIAFDSISE